MEVAANTELNPYQRLPHLESLLMASVLETALTELAILDRCPPSSPESKQTVPPIHGLSTEELTYEKVKNDRSTLSQILAATHSELIMEGTFTTLQQQIKILAGDLKHLDAIVSENSSLKRERRQLTKDLKLGRSKILSATHEADVEIARLMDCLQDEALNSEIVCRYTLRWTCAREEQLALRCASAEATSARRTHEQRQAATHEATAHAELCAVVDEQVKDAEKQIVLWIDKYHTDLRDIEQRVRHQRRRCEVVLNKHSQLSDKFNTQKDQIDKRKEELKMRRIRRELEEKQKAAAVKVQAWWRGMMVRCQLGPFHRTAHTKPARKSGKKK